MRNLLLSTVALVVLTGSTGCSCCRSLMECEQRKNAWLKEKLFGCCHKNPPAAIAPLTAVPGYVSPPTPMIVAPPGPCVSTTPPQIVVAPQQAAPTYDPTAAMGVPTQAMPMAICAPINVCPQECYNTLPACPQTCEPMLSDPCGNPCETMYCP